MKGEDDENDGTDGSNGTWKKEHTQEMSNDVE